MALPHRTPVAPRVGLNPRLHALLSRWVGKVQIGNAGESAVPGAPRFDRYKRSMQSAFAMLGEYYKLSCPYCYDTRYRLWVNHLWCTKDPLTGAPMRHLAVCFNEDCLHAHYKEFEDRVFGFKNAADRRQPPPMPLRPGRAVLSVEPVLPGRCVSIMAAHAGHAGVLARRAGAYLEGRGFDPAMLERERGVTVCVRGDGDYAAVTGRIIIPVHRRGRLVGWQGRWPAELNWKAEGIPKYYAMHGPWKRDALYGYDLATARSPRLVVVVEGPTDVWAGGAACVGLLGKTIGDEQHRMLAEWASRDGLCLFCLDPGAWAAGSRDGSRAQSRRVEVLARLHENFSGRVVEIDLPAGADPGTLARPVFWSVLDEQAKAAGFRLRRFR
jgi:hypothetical protein